MPVQKTQVRSLGQEDPWRREWQPTPVLLPGKSQGQKNQAAVVHGITKSQTQPAIKHQLPATFPKIFTLNISKILHMYVYVCVCERERERKRKIVTVQEWVRKLEK